MVTDPFPRTKLLAGVAAVGAALIFLAGLQRLGSSAILVYAAGAAAVLLLAHPGWAVGVLVGAVVLFENEAEPPLAFGSRLYEFLPGPKITGVDALLVLATAAVALDVVRRKGSLGLGPIGISLGLMAAAIGAGMVTGVSAGSDTVELQEGLRQLLPIVVVPVLVAQVVDSLPKLHRALGIAAAAVAVKAVLGLLSYAGGGSSGSAPGGATFSATYFESTTNLLTMLFLLCCLAALLARVPLAAWVRWTAPVAALCLLLSYRRSFWIATVAGALLVLLMGTGRTGRRLAVPGLVVLAVAGYLVSTTSSPELSGPVGERIQQLSPKRIKADKADRYRLGERRSVWANIKAQPVAGLGIGRPWRQQYPISEQHAGGTSYVHFSVLWWWMRLGILGPIAYLCLLGTTVITAVGVSRRSQDGLARVVALGAAAGIVGFAIAELTATFTGAEIRTTVLVGALIGLVAGARRTTFAT